MPVTSTEVDSAIPSGGSPQPSISLTNSLLKGLVTDIAAVGVGIGIGTVSTFALLPAPATVSGQRWWVLTSTGVWLVSRKTKGAYYSDGTVWSFLGDFPVTAAEVGFTPGSNIVAVNTQAAIEEVVSDTGVLLTAKAATGLVNASGLTQATARVLGRLTAGVGAIEELTAAQIGAFATLPVFTGITLPATPTSGQSLFSRTRSGRDVLATRAMSGAVREFMPQLGSVSARYAAATANSAATAVFGTTMTAVGTNNARTQSATPLFLSAVRNGNTTAVTTAGTSAGWRFNNGTGNVLRGGAAGIGGFYIICRFGVSAITGDGRWFAGLAPPAAIASGDPSTIANAIGVCCDGIDTNIKPMSNGATLGAALASLGANFPAKTAAVDLYELRMFAQPNGTSIGWSLERLNTGDFTENSITTDLPVATTLLSFHLWINNGSTIGSASIDFSSFYQDSPV